MEKHFYHFATKGLEDDILFGSVEGFIAGMNRIALCLCRLGKEHLVIVICFCLMDNHVHFILYGTEEDCILFMETINRQQNSGCVIMEGTICPERFGESAIG
jgi:REP element-mobilizing transposase RayT